jgi:hypothetical protein
VDNNYLDLGMNKSGFVHTLPSGRLTLRSLNIPAVNEAIDICHAKGMTNIMGINYDWNEEVVTQFYANLYIRCETKTFHWLLQGKPLSVSYERLSQILGFGEEDLGRPKLHGGEFPLDSEMAFMYDSMFGKVEFGTTHGMKPVYRMLNQLFRYTLTPKIGDNTNISNVAKEILVRMAPGKEAFRISFGRRSLCASCPQTRVVNMLLGFSR